MARRMGHDAVLKSLEVALSCPGLQSIKLNVVVIKGLNDTEVLDFVDLTKHKRLWVRFIEFMPFTGKVLPLQSQGFLTYLRFPLGNKWDKAKMVPSAELLAVIKKQFPTIERMETIPNETARLWRVPGHSGGIGFISSMSDHFCSTCNRLRITADGQIKVRSLLSLNQRLHGPRHRFACLMGRKLVFVTRCGVVLAMTNCCELSGLRFGARRRNMQAWITSTLSQTVQ